MSLFEAAEQGDLQMVKLLLERGADVNKIDTVGGGWMKRNADND